jgi:hypothetical protein
VSFVSGKAWDTKYLKVSYFGLKPVQAVSSDGKIWMDQFLEDEMKLGYGITIADGLVAQVYMRLCKPIDILSLLAN